MYIGEDMPMSPLVGLRVLSEGDSHGCVVEHNGQFHRSRLGPMGTQLLEQEAAHNSNARAAFISNFQPIGELPDTSDGTDRRMSVTPEIRAYLQQQKQSDNS